ncbi:MAG: hypothetical protein JSU85_09025 [Candidatus Zixiibacteriota bacterium]|nr:MAG: hypothetical protein JSU85_09025 [candidate division Zixibacteria bacterium]
MKIKYPLFMKDRDGCMFLLSSEDDINYHLEHIDVEDKEYDGWNIEGRSVELFIEDKRIKAKYVSEEGDLEMVREAILHYAKIATDVPFLYEKADKEITNLFKEVEKHIRINKLGLFKKIKTRLLEIFKELKEGLYWALGMLIFIIISRLLKFESWENKYGLLWLYSGILFFFTWLTIIYIKLIRRVIRKRDYRIINIIGFIFNTILIGFGWYGIYLSFKFLLYIWIPD